MKYREFESLSFNDLENLAIQTKAAVFDHKNDEKSVVELNKETMKNNGLDPNDKQALCILCGFCIAYFHLIWNLKVHKKRIKEKELKLSK